VLLEHQANPTLRDNYGRTALFIAAEQGKTELMKFLLEKDVSTASIPNNEYWTPLHISAFGMQTVPWQKWAHCQQVI
jgi:ankyrin repeat protein